MTPRTTDRARWAAVAIAMVVALALIGTACRPVQPPGVAPWDPTGVLESVEGGGDTITVTGWATQWDLHVGPDSVRRDRGPVLIAVLMDGEWVKGLFPADEPRADVDRYLVSRTLWNLRQPAMGYGFEITVPAHPGEIGVCVAALNQNLDVLGDIGDHVVLGCDAVMNVP